MDQTTSVIRDLSARRGDQAADRKHDAPRTAVENAPPELQERLVEMAGTLPK